MPQSLSAVYIHLVFSTKDRRPLLRDKPTRDALHSYLGGVSKQLDCPPILAGGVEDHVHLLARFAWQGGYADFSVSESNLKQVKQYIADQVPHRRKMSFPDELRALLRKHRIEWDERYIWD